MIGKVKVIAVNVAICNRQEMNFKILILTDLRKRIITDYNMKTT